MLRFLSKRTGLRKAILWAFIAILVIGLAVVIIAPRETRDFISSYGPAPSASTVVAHVGKYDISLRDLRQGISALGRNQQSGRTAGRQPDIDPDALYPSYGRQALDNLVANALVHSGAHSGISVHAMAGETGVVLLSVSDTGIGIAESEQARILEAGVRLDPDRPGSGLGLALVRAIAEAHGGRLSVASTPGAGATFTISLPTG